jgi:uncharacterized protein DUF2752
MTAGPALSSTVARLLAALVFLACGTTLVLGGQGSLAAVRTAEAWSRGRSDAGPFVCSYQARTGRPCPGCGGTHAFDHASRGRFGAAVRANPLGAAAGLSAWLLLAVAGLVVVTGRGGWLGRALAVVGLGLPLVVAASLVAWLLSA